VFDDASAHAAARSRCSPSWRATISGTGLNAPISRTSAVRTTALGRGGIRRPGPALEYASGVVALDGTPTKRLWELALGERLNHRPVLQDAERTEYVRATP